MINNNEINETVNILLLQGRECWCGISPGGFFHHLWKTRTGVAGPELSVDVETQIYSQKHKPHRRSEQQLLQVNQAPH